MRCGLVFCHCIVKAIEYTGLIPRLLPPFGLYEKQKQSGNEAGGLGMQLEQSGNEVESLGMQLEQSGNEVGSLGMR